MAKTTMLRVFDKVRKIEREITHAAYAAKGPRYYQKLGVVTEDGSEAQVSPNSKPQVQERASVRVVGPVAQESNPAIQGAIQGATDFITQPEKTETQPEQTQAAEKPKRGRKPKSISSSDAQDEK